MPGKNKGIHTVWHETNWANVKEGQKKPLSTHDTKAEAVKKGRTLAKSAKVEHFIHGKDNAIHQRNSYGNDPRNVPG